jgi:hypothetical protein
MYLSTKRFRVSCKTKKINEDGVSRIAVISVTAKAASPAHNDVIVQEDVWQRVTPVIRGWDGKTLHNAKDQNPPDKSVAMPIMGNPTPERLANTLYTRINNFMTGISFSITVEFEDATNGVYESGTYNDEKIMEV